MPKRVSLADKYELASGRIFVTGVQALVRLPLVQRRRDAAAGLDTAGYVTGYRGSPLAGFDLQLGRARPWLEASRVHFQPGLNEDLALTSVWGSQQAEARGQGRHDGVFALWYGKGAGLDRSGDALRHGNLAGSSRHGGVLLLLGDDHRAESSSVTHNSEYTMVDYMVPLLNPADVGDILEYGLYGIALSRFCGAWASLKCAHDVVESTASILLRPDRLPILPEDAEIPPGGLNLRVPDTPLAQEERHHRYRIPAALAFARANRLDQAVWRPARARLGIVTTGKTYLDLRQALDDLGIDAARAAELGLALYKVAMPWPLEPSGIEAFASGLEQIMVIEEKRGLIEPQLKEILFARPGAPRLVGKRDEEGRPLFPAHGVLSSNHIAIELARRLLASADDEALARRLALLEARERAKLVPFAPIDRKPHFCSGCPHNRSTVVPEGSRAMAGTGCNYMVMWMDRQSDGYTQMGADGTNWIGEAPFSRNRHIFQNMGDGTYYHSGILAIRAAIAAKVNITFKILFNDAVAMTGGQPHDGPLTVPRITRQVLAEGAALAVVVTDDPARYEGVSDLAPGVAVRHRDELDQVQRELRDIPGATVLVYDQTCATEKRRRRKRGLMADPPKRAFINHMVCEGCGDCGVTSNCVSVLPRETELGRKREIDQHSCNKDFSCVEGFCPSFVTVHGGRLRRPAPAAAGTRGEATAPPLPEPPPPRLERPWSIVVTGVGGTGIVTIGALLGMAAHIEEKGCAILDMMGLAQKGGAVTTHLRLAASPEAIRSARVPSGGADLVLGGDIMTVAGAEPLATIDRGRSRVIVNTHETMTGEFTRKPDLAFPGPALRQRIEAAAGAERVEYLDAVALAEAGLGDPIAANMLMVGYAYQKGLIPLSLAAIEQAIELNGVVVALNKAALAAGRRAALAPAPGKAPEKASEEPPAADLDQVIAHRMALLTAYQDRAYAERYRRLVGRVRDAETRHLPGERSLALAVARNLAKLMAIKDEYEVARLHASPEFRRELESRFEGSYKLEFHLAPPLLAPRDPVTGRLGKRGYGGWVLPVFHLLARLRRLRGTALDIFGHTAERRRERRLLADYEAMVERLIAELRPETHGIAVALAAIPEEIRGYGHVKEAAMDRAKAREEALLARLAGTPALAAAE